MCAFIALGVTIRLLGIESLDNYWLQIKSSRLEFLFFIGMAACYIPLLFILIERYWINFFTQLLCSIILFILLLFIFAPPLKVKIYLFDYDTAFLTRSWAEVDNVYVGQRVKYPKPTSIDKQNKMSADDVLCPTSYNYYFFSFVFTFHTDLSKEFNQQDNKKLETYCFEAKR